MSSQAIQYVVALVLLLVCGDAAAQRIRQIFVFGDSYSAYEGDSVGKDGPTSIVYAARALGLPIVSSDQGVTTNSSVNFAVGGATTGYEHVGGPTKPKIGLRSQVELFQNLLKQERLRFDAQSTLFFIEGGLNDRNLTTAETVANLIDEIRSLYALGGRHFRLAILPTRVPRFHAIAERLNPELAAIPQAIGKELPGIDIEMSHWGRFYDEVFDHATSYGFINTTDPCFEPGTNGSPASVCASPRSYFYYPINHPSTEVHRIASEKLSHELGESFAH